jgi:hypothetical protein
LSVHACAGNVGKQSGAVSELNWQHLIGFQDKKMQVVWDAVNVNSTLVMTTLTAVCVDGEDADLAGLGEGWPADVSEDAGLARPLLPQYSGVVQDSEADLLEGDDGEQKSEQGKLFSPLCVEGGNSSTSNVL